MTTGFDQDPDGYTFEVAGVTGVVPVSGYSVIPGIKEGQWPVTLTGVAGNCSVSGNPRMVDVAAGGTASVLFRVACRAAGSIQVTVTTTGVYPDIDGYHLVLQDQSASATASGHVPTNGSATFAVPLGQYLVTLSGMAANCAAASTNPPTVAVGSGGVALLSLGVACISQSPIVFVTSRVGGSDIHVLDLNESRETQLTADNQSNVDPIWSPDGNRIAFSSNRGGDFEIYVMDADGRNTVRLTSVMGSDRTPAWSPDGQRIAFSSDRDGNSELYVMKADGTSQVRLTNNPARDFDPAWSPDGNRIVFASTRDNSPGLWVMGADGSGLTRLTSHALGDERPAWSPDGSLIAFDRVLDRTSDPMIMSIYFMNADGSNVTPLTRGDEWAGDPTWSPDGRKIAFTTSACDAGFYYYYCDQAIDVIGLDFTAYATVKYGNVSQPSWRPR